MGAGPSTCLICMVLMLRGGVPVQDATCEEKDLRLYVWLHSVSRKRSPKNRCCGDALGCYASRTSGRAWETSRWAAVVRNGSRYLRATIRVPSSP